MLLEIAAPSCSLMHLTRRALAFFLSLFSRMTKSLLKEGAHSTRSRMLEKDAGNFVPPRVLSKIVWSLTGFFSFFFFAEEYTKISTPRQEVLFKKGSIGAKKRSPAATTATSPPVVDGEEQQQNLNAASPTSPVRLSCDTDSFHYSGKKKKKKTTTKGFVFFYNLCH